MDLRQVLPAGLELDGKYRIERVIGAGGFGITYAAHDVGLNTTVALKEYYPAEFGVRDGTMTVRPKSEQRPRSVRAAAPELRARGAHARQVQASLDRARALGVRVARHCLHGHGVRGRAEPQGLAEGAWPQADAGRARPHVHASARCARGVARRGFPASRHRAGQHHHPGRTAPRCCSTSAPPAASPPSTRRP